MQLELSSKAALATHPDIYAIALTARRAVAAVRLRIFSVLLRLIAFAVASYNIDAMASSLSVIAGTPKVYKDRGNTGGGVVRYFCGDCGSSLWAEVNSVPGITYISAALFPMDRGVGMELFCKNMSSELLSCETVTIKLIRPW